MDYAIYVVTMTILLSFSLDLGINKGNSLGFLLMLASYFNTMIFLLLFSGSSIITVASVLVILLVVPITLRNLGFNKSSMVALLMVNEIIMSLLYFVMLRGFPESVVALDFYGTDVPSIAVTSFIQIIEALVELSNSFMFFLMVFPEVAYFAYRRKELFPVLLSSVALCGPNVASEMTHSILPLPYDPIKEASVVACAVALCSSVYLTYKLSRGKLSGDKFLVFLLVNLFLSLSSLYYSITLNALPYGLFTMAAVFLSMMDFRFSFKAFKWMDMYPAIPQLLWGMSVAIWYGVFTLEYAVGIGIALLYLFFIHLSAFQRSGGELQGRK